MSDISTAKITADELQGLFGESMPMEGVTILQTASSPDDARAQLKALTTRLAPDWKDLADAEARIMQDYRWGNLTKLGVANHLRRAGFKSEVAVAKANALTPATAPDREAIARIIDPDGWGWKDSYLKRYGCNIGGVDVSLTKADAILSLMGEV